MRDFRNLTIWNASRFLVKEVYMFTQKLLQSKKTGLISPINSCSISVPANISVDCVKKSDRDFGRFFQISLGSLYEVESHITLCQDLEFSNRNNCNAILEKYQILQKQIATLINKL